MLMIPPIDKTVAQDSFSQWKFTVCTLAYQLTVYSRAIRP